MCMVNISVPTTCLGLHGLYFPLAVFSENQIYRANLCCFQYHYSCLSNEFIHMPEVYFFFQFPFGNMKLFWCLFCNILGTTPCLAFQYNLINHCHVILKHPVCSHVFLVFDLCTLANLWWYVLWAVIGFCLVKLPVVVSSLSCNLGHL